MKEKCDCCQETVENGVCNCCDGIDVATPVPIYNRPGLRQLAYRIGTHSAFLASMKARLSGFYFENRGGDGNLARTYPLERLTTRNSSDPAIALLDSWATVADVLSFYQERIANEGYLRTATERRSVVELANLVGYRPRPGVSASVFLAYTMDPNTQEEVIIPAGSRVQSIPGANEMPQAFETGEALKAKAQWNNLKPRMTQPQTELSIIQGDGTSRQIYLKGISTNLKTNDPLLVDFSGDGELVFERVKEVKIDPRANHTLVILQSAATRAGNAISSHVEDRSIGLIDSLTKKPSVQPANSSVLKQNLREQFGVKQVNPEQFSVNNPSSGTDDVEELRKTLTSGEASNAVLKAFSPELHGTFSIAAANAKVTQSSKLKVYALRTATSLFGHNALREPVYDTETQQILPQSSWNEWGIADDEDGGHLFLANEHDRIIPDSYIAIQYPKDFDLTSYEIKPFRVSDVVVRSRNAYGLSITTTVISLPDGQTWWQPTSGEPDDFSTFIRGSTVYAESELLELAEEPMIENVCGGINQLIELDGYYEGLEAGRWVIVSGEREIGGTSGVRFSELAMLASVRQDTKHINADDLEGNTLHTFIRLAEELNYCFKRETVTIYGNVVKATHGETRSEVLGSGDGAKPLQNFTLKQFPLTHVSAADPSGTASTLKVYVNNIEWREIDSLVGSGANDRCFITRTDDENKTSVVFGNGKQGARLPTGIENIRAEYRNGIGKAGNVKAEQISLLVSRPLGVKEVINPLRASGGADRESRDQARRHVPLAVKALDRLVSTQDYEDFSRVYAGIGKAYAIELSNGRLPLIHVTVAGADDIPIDTSSDLFRNLRQALYDSGDPFQKIQLAVRELLLIVIEAGIAILPDYRWEFVADEVRGRLLDQFSFERRELGQDVLLSEVISVMQSVAGVAYVDVNAFGGIPEKQPLTAAEIKLLTKNGSLSLLENRRLLTPDEIADEVSRIISRIQHLTEQQLTALPAGEPLRVPQRLVVDLPRQEQFIRPAQLAILSPDVPATLILNQIK